MTQKPKPGDKVIFTEIPAGLLDGLPAEDQEAIRDALGIPVALNEYDDLGRAELQFTAKDGLFISFGSILSSWRLRYSYFTNG